MMQLTALEPVTGGTRPILINSEHVVWARPMVTHRNSGVSQVPALTPMLVGTELSLVNGDSYKVKDPFDSIAQFLVKATEPPAPEEAAPAADKPPLRTPAREKTEQPKQEAAEKSA